MELTGEHRISAPQEAVWRALNDADVLKTCVPGCESMEKIGDTEFKAVAIAKVGPVKAKFSGKVTLSDIDAPNGYKITGEGTGGAAGFAKGGANVQLVTDGAETVLTYQVDAQVGGKLAQIGQRFIDAAAKKMADDFFSAFSEELGQSSQTELEAEATPAPTGEPADLGARAGLWVPVLIILAIVLLGVIAG